MTKWYIIKTINGQENQVKLFKVNYLVDKIIITANIRNVSKIPGVINVLSTNNSENKISIIYSESHNFFEKVNQLHANEIDMYIPFKVGEEVKITDGPFKGVSGIVLKINKETNKITLKLINLKTLLTIKLTIIKNK